MDRMRSSASSRSSARRPRARDALELIGAEGHAILHAQGDGVLEIELDDGIYNVFAIEEGSITRIDDYAERRRALAAAGLSSR